MTYIELAAKMQAQTVFCPDGQDTTILRDSEGFEVGFNGIQTALLTAWKKNYIVFDCRERTAQFITLNNEELEGEAWLEFIDLADKGSEILKTANFTINC